MLHLWLRMLVAPRSKDKERSRREFILNILLVGLILLSSAAFTINVIGIFFYNRKVGASPIIAESIIGVLLLLYLLSRKGRINIAATSLIVFFLSAATYLNYIWGADLPANLLIFALIIVMAGILIGSQFAFFVTVFSAGSILLFTCLEIVGIIHPNRIRTVEAIHITDSIVHVLILGIIAIVSWLFNRESERALKRAKDSETALQLQKDKLEVLVEKRTRQLKQVQAEKIIQLYRFAEFGRMASGLFHDLVDPLSLVSLNLDKLSGENKKMKREEIKRLLDRAVIGTKRLESFVLTARKQMQNQEILQSFVLGDEINQIIQMLSYKAKATHVHITFIGERTVATFGNPMKFSQVMTNLIINAIDSYDTSSKKEKRIVILLHIVKGYAKVSVQDWGVGIKEEDLSKIFDSLFTTKGSEKGTGIGLAISHDIIQKNFRGKIQVESKENTGTIFTITFPIRSNPCGKIKKQSKT